MPMSGRGRWTVENDGPGLLAGLALVVVVAIGVVAAVVWLLTATPFVAIAVTVVSVLCAAGAGAAVRNVRRDRGQLYRAPTESLLLKALAWRPAARVRTVPVPALPARVPLAIEAPKPPLTGVVIESRETAELRP